MDPGFSDLFQSTAISDLPKLKIKGFFWPWKLYLSIFLAVDYMPVYPGSQEGKLHPGMHQTQHNQLVKTGDSPAVFHIGAALPWVLCAGLGPTI